MGNCDAFYLSNMIYGPSCFQFSDLLVAKGDADVRDQHNPTSKYLKFSFFHLT